MSGPEPITPRDASANVLNEIGREFSHRNMPLEVAVALAQAQATLAVADAVIELAKAVRYTRDGGIR